jgi:glycosyltransferase involved in cell wall biosynthesis
MRQKGTPSLDAVFSTKAHSVIVAMPASREGSAQRCGGRACRDGYVRKSLPGKSLVSVVTVVFNAEDCLEKTIQSVINQSYDNIEYIIIDGGSNDRTVDIIKSYADKIDYWVSEHDNGIYDAMNKGIDIATGSWINFMNAGDIFYNADTLMRCSKFMDREGAVHLYGDTAFDYGSFIKHLRAKPLNRLWRGMCFSHQSAFVKLDYHKQEKFNLNYPIAADFDFFLRGLVSGEPFVHIGETVSLTSVEGVSDSNRRSVICQHRQTARHLCPSLIHECYFIYALFENALRYLVKLLLPNMLVSKIKKMK